MATITANDGGQPARLAPLRQWLEQIVATLPEPRQRMYDLFVARGLDSRNAALELGTSIAEVRRLRGENQQAILRAFEVTALAAAETAGGPPGGEAAGCGELRQLLADARHDDGDPPPGGRHRTVVLPAALRLTVSRHLAQCRACQGRRDDCMARWGPGLLPILADTERRERIVADVQPTPEPGQSDARRHAAPAGVAGLVVVRRAAAAAAGAGLLVALLLIAFGWPGALPWTRGSTAPPSPDRDTAATGGVGAPTVTGTFDRVPGGDRGRPARPTMAGRLSSRPPAASGSPAAPSARPSAYYTVQPSTAPASSPAQPTSGPSSPGWPVAPSPSSPARRTTPPTPSAAPSTTPPAAPPSSVPPGTPTPTPTPGAPTPTPSVTDSTPAPSPTASDTASAPSPTASDPSSAPSPTASDPGPAPTASAPSSSAASPTAPPSAAASAIPPPTAAPSASAAS